MRSLGAPTRSGAMEQMPDTTGVEPPSPSLASASTSAQRKRGVRGLGCTVGCLAGLLSLVPLGLFGAVNMAAADCVGCEVSRTQESLALGTLVSFGLALAGGILAAIGGLISRSRPFPAGILLVITTAFIAL